MRSQKVRDYFSSIFPHLLLLLLHFSTARLRLGHDWEWCRVQKYQKKGAGRENRAKMALFWTQKIKKKKIRASQPQPDGD